VSVATSITQRGLNCLRAYVIASHRISRPSASVLMISIVCPDMLLTMSPGRVARPLGMFSQAGITATTLTGASSSAIADIAPSTLPAPDMSYFISSILGGGFSEMPPVSNVTPLPQSATGASFAGPLRYSMAMTRGGSSAPCVTESRAPMPSLRISRSPSTLTLSLRCRPASLRAVSAR
jgi:hypothetical protein